MLNNRYYKIFIFVGVLSLIKIPLLIGQTSLNQLEQIIHTLDNSWKSEIDLQNKKKHIILLSGEPIGILKLKKDSNEIEYYIYKPLKNKFTDEIKDYHQLASCILVSEINRPLKFKDYILFLPMYPCWVNGYSKEGKKLIEKLVIKFN